MNGQMYMTSMFGSFTENILAIYEFSFCLNFSIESLLISLIEYELI